MRRRRREPNTAADVIMASAVAPLVLDGSSFDLAPLVLDRSSFDSVVSAVVEPSEKAL